MSFEENNYYEVLQVEPTANQVDIDASFRRLARLYHPDRNESTFATTFMQELNVAYSVLRDPQQRLEYDKQLDAYAAYERSVRRRQRGSSLNRLFIIPALIALFIFSFIVLVDPATRIGSRSIRSSNIPGVVSGTVVAMPLNEPASSDGGNANAASNALISDVASNNQVLDKNLDHLGAPINGSKAEPESLDQAIAVRPTVGLIIETATATVTTPPTPTPVATAALTSQPTAENSGDVELASSNGATQAKLDASGSVQSAASSTSTFTPTLTPTPTATATATLIPTSVATSTSVPTSTSSTSAASSSAQDERIVADLFRGVVSQDTMLYLEPNENASFASAYAGSVLQAVARSNDGLWYQLDNGYWIAARYVSRNGDGAASKPEVSVRETETAVASSSTLAHAASLMFPWQGVAIQNTNLYSAPGQENAIIAGLFEGTPVIVIGLSDDGKWYRLNDGYWLTVEAVSPQ